MLARRGTRDGDLTQHPTLAQFQFRARNHWIGGGHNRTSIKGFYGAGQEDTSRSEPFVLDADEPPLLLGENQAPNAPRIRAPPRQRRARKWRSSFENDVRSLPCINDRSVFGATRVTAVS